MTLPDSGLYAITDTRLGHSDALIDGVGAAIAGGAKVIQYRDKSHDAMRRQAEATRLQELCTASAIPLIINDDVDLAAAVGAAGVHLGRDDLSVAEARARLPAASIVGCSCYDRFDLARDAAAAGADYIAFGSFFPSPTKPNAVRAPIDLLRRARRDLAVPAVAIGGITPENGGALVAAGATWLAVITAVFAAADICQATRAFDPCFDDPQEIPP